MSRHVALHPAVILVVLAIGGPWPGSPMTVTAVPLTAAGVAIGGAMGKRPSRTAAGRRPPSRRCRRPLVVAPG